MRLELAQCGHVHRSRHAHAPEVVAREIHDHHVLGPVLRAREQPGRRHRGALDRAGLHLPAFDAQESLGGRGHDGDLVADRVGSGAQEGRVRRGVAGFQRAPQRNRIGRPVRGEPAGEVDLVAVARLDVLDDRPDAGLELRPVQARRPRPEARPEIGGPPVRRIVERGFEVPARGAPTGDPGGAGAPVDLRMGRKAHEAHIRDCAFAHRRIRTGPPDPLDAGPELVGDEAGPPPRTESIQAIEGARAVQRDDLVGSAGHHRPRSVEPDRGRELPGQRCQDRPDLHRCRVEVVRPPLDSAGSLRRPHFVPAPASARLCRVASGVRTSCPLPPPLAPVRTFPRGFGTILGPWLPPFRPGAPSFGVT